MPDLVASIKDGRVFKQACCLAAAPQRGIIILEGSSACLRKSNMHRAAIQGLLIKISVFLNIPVLRAKDAEESARLILYTVRQSQKLTGSVNNHTRHFPHKRPKAKQKLSSSYYKVFQVLGQVEPKHYSTILVVSKLFLAQMLRN